MYFRSSVSCVPLPGDWIGFVLLFFGLGPWESGERKVPVYGRAVLGLVFLVDADTNGLPWGFCELIGLCRENTVDD
jgi:hypothetical protein